MKNIKNYIAKITELLTNYKKTVDTIEEGYIKAGKEVREKAQAMSGKWTQEYQGEYILANSPDAEYKAMFDTARKGFEPKVSFYLTLISKSIDRYFNQPVNSDFINKITAVKNMGVRLTDEEFKMLEGEANTYFEHRLLIQLEESRTKEQAVYKVQDGAPTASIEEVPDSYGLGRKQLPTIDSLKIGFKNYKAKADVMLQIYSGENGTMYSLLDDKNVEQFNALAAGAYLTGGAHEEFLKVLNPYLEMCGKSKTKTTLTEAEQRLIDSIIDKRYPSMAKEKVEEICRNSPELTELLLLDDRYSKYAANVVALQ